MLGTKQQRGDVPVGAPLGEGQRRFSVLREGQGRHSDSQPVWLQPTQNQLTPAKINQPGQNNHPTRCSPGAVLRGPHHAARASPCPSA